MCDIEQTRQEILKELDPNKPPLKSAFAVDDPGSSKGHLSSSSLLSFVPHCQRLANSGHLSSRFDGGEGASAAMGIDRPTRSRKPLLDEFERPHQTGRP